MSRQDGWPGEINPSPDARCERPVNRRELNRRIELGYLIAAYTIVIGSLVVYALWIHGQRRKLIGQRERNPNLSKEA